MQAPWRSDDIAIEILEAEGSVTIIEVTTPVGVAQLLGDVRISGRTLLVHDAHVQGLSSGAVGRPGINAVLRKLLVEADVEQIVVQGAARTTGRTEGRRPRPIRFPRSGKD